MNKLENTRTFQSIAMTMNGSQALEIINESTAKVGALAAIPIPLVDVAGTTYIQIKMVRKLAELHNVSTEEENSLMIVSFITSLISKLVSEIFEKLSDTVGIGKVIGESLVKATVAGFLTKLTGEVYQDHFSRGGTLEDMSLVTVADYITYQLKTDRYSVDTLVSQFMDKSLKKLGVA